MCLLRVFSFNDLVAARYPGERELQEFTKKNLELMKTNPQMCEQILAHPFIKHNIVEASNTKGCNSNSR